MKWLEPQPVDVPLELQAAVGGHALVAQALVRRGISTPQAALAFLDPAQYTPTPPWELPDMDLAVRRLQDALARGERILVWGDFDTDGLTATAVLVEALRALGGQVDWYVPDRRIESHGVHWHSLQPFLGRGARVLLTCDTGITAHEPLALARNAGLDVIVTDHHALPPALPTALAIVNPNRLPEGHPLHYLSGVGVAYELAVGLGVPERGLDLAGLGLVADVVPQRGEVRYLVQRGLQALHRAERVGVQALLEVAEVDPASVDEDHIAFSLAPRLNALGRLAHASAGVELFLTDDLARARAIAAEMEVLNVRRQFLSRQVTAAARELALRDRSAASAPVWVLAQPHWPAAVLGIAAGRLAERFYRPVVLIANPPGETARGSARSIPGVDIRAALAQHSALFGSFGGHPMAAGFSLSEERVPELRRALIASMGAQVGAARPERELPVEAYFSLPELDLELLGQVSRLAPFGAGNPALTLATQQVRIASHKTIGRTGEHRRLALTDAQGHTQEVLWWQSADLPLPDGAFDLAYVLRANEFAGERRLQLQWVDARGAERPLVELAPAAAIEVADYRSLLQPLPDLRALWDAGTTQLWAEGLDVTGFPARGRHQLQPGPVLAVWTPPPGPREWEQALRRVGPQQAYLFAVDAALDAPEAFLRRLGGLVKHALVVYAGRLEWEALAAATGQRAETVRAGVRWLEARGQMALVAREEGAVYVSAGGRRDEGAQRSAWAELCELLRETAAYRAYWRGAEGRRLVGGR